jgi:imidazole glycerol-phosphate synthase subunit HisH
MSIAIVDYGSGNLHSAAKAFERAAREAGLNTPVIVTSDPDVVRAADRIVLPGVGAFADCRAGLDAVPGMVEVLSEQVRARGKPFLGICVGMQLMASRGLEYQITPGLNWIPGDVRLIEPESGPYKVPHMGWNTLHPQAEHALLEGIATGPEGLHAYFVHSYALVARDVRNVLAYTNHGGPVTAIVAQGNMAGTQFHPEKSQQLGLKFITNFIRWTP